MALHYLQQDLGEEGVVAHCLYWALAVVVEVVEHQLLHAGVVDEEHYLCSALAVAVAVEVHMPAWVEEEEGLHLKALGVFVAVKVVVAVAAIYTLQESDQSGQTEVEEGDEILE